MSANVPARDERSHKQTWASVTSQLREYYVASEKLAASERLAGLIRWIEEDEKISGAIAEDAQDLL